MMITCDDLLVLVLQLFLIQRCSFTFISFNNDIDADNIKGDKTKCDKLSYSA